MALKKHGKFVTISITQHKNLILILFTQGSEMAHTIFSHACFYDNGHSFGRLRFLFLSASPSVNFSTFVGA